MPLRGSCDVVAFVSEPDSMISPSEGVDGDLDLRDAIARMERARDFQTFKGSENLIVAFTRSFREKRGTELRSAKLLQTIS